MRRQVKIRDEHGNQWSKWADECELTLAEIAQLENGETVKAGGLTFYPFPTLSETIAKYQRKTA